MSDKIPEDELQDWLYYVDNPDNILDQERKMNISDPLIIDLHFKTLANSIKIIEKTLNFAFKNHIKNIQLITGIGKNEHSDYGTLHT